MKKLIYEVINEDSVTRGSKQEKSFLKPNKNRNEKNEKLAPLNVSKIISLFFVKD